MLIITVLIPPRSIKRSESEFQIYFYQGLDSYFLFTYNNIIIRQYKKGDDMGWRENKDAYIKSYVKGNYHRFTIIFRKDDKNEVDSAVWEAIKDSPSKAQALKDLAYKGLKK